MPEAVIVAAARSPIGRAFKGSLKDMRPDDLAAQMAAADAAEGLGGERQSDAEYLAGLAAPVAPEQADLAQVDVREGVRHERVEAGLVVRVIYASFFA